MDKVLLVDDEDIERETMAGLIPWNKIGMELVDAAWNGIEGLEKIRRCEPDIVITDIKMPVMDGIELIRRAREIYPDMLFVVLSGYGDYEFTSQAMELGIRHYILKPCDEDKIVEVLLNAREELETLREKKKSEQEYKTSFKRMIPRLKEHILYELITKKELSPLDQGLLRNFPEDLTRDFVLLSVRGPGEFGHLDSFVFTNILLELLRTENVYMSAAFRGELVYLIPDSFAGELAGMVKRACQEYEKYNCVSLSTAVSRAGKITESYRLYEQIQELFYFGEAEERKGFLCYDMYGSQSTSVSAVISYEEIKNAKSYGELVFAVSCSSMKMILRGDSVERMREIFSFALRILFGGETVLPESCADRWMLVEQVVDVCAVHLNLMLPDTKSGNRLKEILYAIYKNIQNPDLSLQYLAQNVLYMNEDYFGRFFHRCMHEKYSSFLTRTRILLAERLLSYRPDLKITELAELTGYPSDGQYLMKVFKKYTGMLLSDYRKKIK